MNRARVLRVGTRGSALALAQTTQTMRRLEAAHPGLQLEAVRIATRGDVHGDMSLAALGRGAFVDAIEAALAAGEVDLAVHSAKDLPSSLGPGFTLGAVLERADARDVFISPHGTLAALPAGARVGTSSPRRQCQLRAYRPDLQVVEMRGNVDTRLRKLDAGEFDGILLAAAGLLRLGLESRATEWLEPAVMLPAVGQGALAIETRAGDAEVAAIVGALDHLPTRAAVEAERGLLARLGAGCTAPVAAHARYAGGVVRLEGMIGAMDGRSVRGTREGTSGEARALGTALAEALIAEGGGALLAEAGRAPASGA